MESVSAGDLYYELGFHRWMVEGLIPKPGSLHRFSRLDDPILHLFDNSGISLTVNAAEKLLTRIMKAVAANFRCKPNQSLKKPMIGDRRQMMNAIEVELRSMRDIDPKQSIEQALKPLLDGKMIANILYEKFRNSSIHGIRVEINEECFFTSHQPYWKSLYSEYYPPFMFFEAPALFLMEILENCLRTVHKKMLATKKLPPDIHYYAFGSGTENLNVLEDKLLPIGRDIRFHIK